MIIKEYKNKTVLKGMSLDEIKQWCQEQNQSSYRAQQIYQWMYKHGVQDAEEMENISHKLGSRIKELAERYETPQPQLTDDVKELSGKFDQNLEKMGFEW